MMALTVLAACDGRRAVSPPEQEAVGPAGASKGHRESGIAIADPDEGAIAIPGRPGQRLPLTRILEIARAFVPGEIIEVELDDEHGKTEYEVKILTAGGRKIEMKIDAVSGRILESEED